MRKIFVFIVGNLIGGIISFFIDKAIAELFLGFLYLYFFLEILVWMREKANKSEIRNNLQLVKKPSKRPYNLFTWLGESKSSDKIIFELVEGNIEGQNTIETMKLLKETIKKKVNGELSEYYMIREIILNSRKDNFGVFFKGIINKVILGSIGIAIITGFINKNEAINFNFRDFFSINFIVEIAFIVFGIIGIFLIFYDIVSKSNTRANIVLIVLDEIIKEKEEKNGK